MKLVVGRPESSNRPFWTFETVKTRPASVWSGSVALRFEVARTTVAPSLTARLFSIRMGGLLIVPIATDR